MPRVSFRTADGQRVSFTAKKSSGKRRTKRTKRGSGLKGGAFRKGASIKAPKGSRRGSVVQRGGKYFRVMKDPHGRALIAKPITKPR